MRNLNKFLIAFACLFAIVVAVPTKDEEKGALRETKKELTGLYQKLQQIGNRLNRTGEQMFGKRNRTAEHGRPKRQLAFGGGFGMGFGAYDYNDYYGEYVSDYAYDYYDWICSDTACQLCDILTSECCDPAIDVNCFLPDSCLNNPCLSGGTCITTRTLDNQPDFICVCLPGLTGKYCQLVNDYFVGAEIAFAPAVAAVGVGAIDPAAAAAVATDADPAATDAAAAAADQTGMASAAPSASVAAGTFVDPNNQMGQQFQAQPMQAAGYGNAQYGQQMAQPLAQPVAQPQQQYGQQYGQQQAQPDVQQLQQQLQAYQQLVAQLQQQASSGQAATQNLAMTSNNQADNAQLKVAAIKRKRCGVGQIFSAEQQRCVDFSLAQSNRKK